MKDIIKNRVMKPAALIAVYASIYPAAMAGRVALFKSQRGIFDFVLSLFFLLSGYVISTFIMSNKQITFFKKLDEFGNKLLTANIFKNSKGKAMRMLLAYSILLIPFAISGAIYNGTWRSLYEAAFATIFYFIGARAAMTDISGILSRSRISFGIFALAMTLYVCSKFTTLSGVKTLTYIFGYASMFITMLLKSQANLDYNLFARKGLDKQGTAVNMRRYNTGMSIVIFLITVLALNLKNIVTYLLGLTRDIISALVVLFFAITTMLFPMSEGGTPPQTKQEAVELPPGDEGGLARLILNILLYLAVAAIIVYILYKLYKVVPGQLKALLKKINDAIKKRMGLLFSNIENNDEYSDEVEVIKPDDGTAKSTFRKTGSKKLKQNISKIKDPVLKVRAAYGSVVSGLKRQRIEIFKSDTPEEIYYKAQSISGIESELKKITSVYEKVRYGDKIPDEKMLTELENNYDDINHKLGSKKIPI